METQREIFELYPYQKEGISFLLERNGNAILADEPRLGKTPQSIFYLNACSDPFPLLIVCQSTLKYYWEQEINRLIAHRLYNGVKVFKVGSQPDLGSSAFIINYDNLYKNKKILKGFKTVIFDESQFLANVKSKRTKAAFEICSTIPHKLFLTGTPMNNRPRDLFPMLKCLAASFDEADRFFVENWFRFTQKFCDGHFKEQFIQGGRKIRIYDDTGCSNRDQLHILLKKVMLRRTQKEVLGHLPLKTKKIIPIEDSDDDIECSFQERLDSAEANFDRLGSTAVKSDYEIYAINRKMPMLLNFIKEIAGNEPVVVAAHHKCAMEQLSQGLKDYNPIVIDGSTEGNRFALAEEFQKNAEHKVFILSIKCAPGLTLHRAKKIVICENTWTSTEIAQVESRCDNIFAENSVEIYYMILRNSIDGSKVLKVNAKNRNITTIVDGKEKSNFFKSETYDNAGL